MLLLLSLLHVCIRSLEPRCRSDNVKILREASEFTTSTSLARGKVQIPIVNSVSVLLLLMKSHSVIPSGIPYGFRPFPGKCLLYYDHVPFHVRKCSLFYSVKDEHLLIGFMHVYTAFLIHHTECEFPQMPQISTAVPSDCHPFINTRLHKCLHRRVISEFTFCAYYGKSK